MNSQQLHDIAVFAQDIATQAGQLIVRERQTVGLQRDYKNQHELVTQADIKADELITKAIRRAYPDHRILSEESLPDLQQAKSLQEPLWIIDPIDGTVNYAHGQFQVGVSIAFAVDGKVQTGVVHCPYQGETFHAIRGKGAVMNHRQIAPSQTTDLARALIATGFPYDKSTLPPMLDRLVRVLPHIADIRRLGSAALDICWVAMGRLDGYYESLSPWDFAAAQLIAAEAGCRVGRFSAVPSDHPEELWGKDIIITTPGIYDGLLALVTD